MNNYNICELPAQEWALAYPIECAAHAFPWSKQTFQDNFGERYLNLQLRHAEGLAGFAICQTVLDEATLFNLAVDPRYQGQGLGRALLQALVERLEARGVLTLWLEVRESNTPARALYEAEGFNEVSRRKNYYPTADGREDAVIMALPLG
ncbi:MAG: ribosomal protein S18-alanine N-acetyltransferase [Plesiomonas sp.]